MRRNAQIFYSRIVFLFLFLVISSESPAFAKKTQDSGGRPLPFEIVSGESCGMKYRLLRFRKRWFSLRKYPLVLLLHGAQQIPDSVLNLWAEEAVKRHVMIVAPAWKESPQGKEKDEALFDLVRSIKNYYPVDERKIFVAGISAGGEQAQKLVSADTQYWRGIVFMSYVPPLDWVHLMASMRMSSSVFFTYGMKDSADRYSDLMKTERYLRERGGNVGCFIDPSAGHEYRTEWNKIVFDWIIRCSKNSGGGKTYS